MGQSQYGPRRSVYVSPMPNAKILYGFKTNVKAGTSTAAGHTNVDPANLPANLCFGVNAPKPGRASKSSATESESTFYDHSKYGELRQNGWRVSKPFYRLRSNGARSTTVYVTLGTIKYAWNMPDALLEKIADDASGLGITAAEANDKDLVWGCRTPRPPKASKVVTGEGQTNVLTTFYDPSKASLPGGWTGSGKQYVNLG